LAGYRGDPDEASVLRAIDVAAERLGNTRAVCRSSYVHPMVVDSYLEGGLNAVWKSSRNGRWLDREESALRRVLSGGI
jgi:DNA topoisomerase-1